MEKRSMGKYPLVSVLIPNYNYGKYLENCLDSVLNQTYPNIEVLFRDNDSSDNSYDIAMSYREKFKKKGYFYDVSKNRSNIGSFFNADRILKFASGRFFHNLGSDDVIKPAFIETCINVFLRYPNVGTVIVHREDIDEAGNKRTDPPFYNKSCIVDGKKQAAVYMMAGIGVPTQCMYDKSKMTPDVYKYWKRYSVAGDWFYNFLFSICGDVAYIKKPLCQYRTHLGNETSASELNLLGTFEHYMLINDFVVLGEIFKIKEVVNRKDAAIEKLGSMCMRYAIKMFHNNLHDIAAKYLHLAPIYKPDITKEKIYRELQNCLNLQGQELVEQIKKIESTYATHRTISYDPPKGSQEIQLKKIQKKNS